jgi:hypothetical protein
VSKFDDDSAPPTVSSAGNSAGNSLTNSAVGVDLGRPVESQTANLFTLLGDDAGALAGATSDERWWDVRPPLDVRLGVMCVCV